MAHVSRLTKHISGGLKAKRIAHGVIMDGDGKCLADTIQCAHCGMHWVANPQVWPNFCTGCGQVVCWQQKCREHMHREKKMDLYEKGKIAELR